MFYPEKQYLYISLATATPAFAALLLLGFREKIWNTNKCWIFTCIKPLLIFSVLTDLSLHTMMASLDRWQFSWVIAFTLLIDLLIFYYLIKDKHTKLMLIDWKIPITSST
jgi:phosphoglycerol transferase MdoB-like AlkP superfamily enzyme